MPSTPPLASKVLGVTGLLENQQQVPPPGLPQPLPLPFPTSFLRSTGKRGTHLSPPLPLDHAEQPTRLALETGCGPDFTSLEISRLLAGGSDSEDPSGDESQEKVDHALPWDSR